MRYNFETKEENNTNNIYPKINHMRSYLKKTSITLLLIFVFSILLTFIGIYQPLLKEIEKNSLDYFKLLAESRIDIFHENITKNLQQAKSLSSRSGIRDKAIEYLDGKVDLREIQSFTSGRYLDGIRIADDIIYAIRIVDGNEITAVYNIENIKDDLKIAYETIEKTRLLNYSIVEREGKPNLDVISPIFAGSRIVGYDILGFSLEDTIKSLNSEETKFDIYFNLGKDSGKNKRKFEELGESEGEIYFLKEYMANIGLIVSQNSTVTFKHKDTLQNETFIHMFIGYGLILVLVFILLGRETSASVRYLSMDRDTYKKYADMDTLTGAYSRLFLDIFAKEYPDSQGTLVLLDLDEFKDVNDKHGHLIGDEVLKYFVYRLKKIIRSDDLVVRYGGDEFLIVLRDIVNEEIALNLICRIKDDLKKQNHFSFNIEFSYGISMMDSLQDINKHIKIADKKMYLNKEGKKL